MRYISECLLLARKLFVVMLHSLSVVIIHFLCLILALEWPCVCVNVPLRNSLVEIQSFFACIASLFLKKTVKLIELGTIIVFICFMCCKGW